MLNLKYLFNIQVKQSSRQLSIKSGAQGNHLGGDTNFRNQLTRNVSFLFHSPLPHEEYPIWPSYMTNSKSTVSSVPSTFAMGTHLQDYTSKTPKRLNVELV